MEETIAKDGKFDDYLAETASRLGSSSEEDNHEQEEPEVALTDLSYIFFGRAETRWAGIYLDQPHLLQSRLHQLYLSNKSDSQCDYTIISDDGKVRANSPMSK